MTLGRLYPMNTDSSALQASARAPTRVRYAVIGATTLAGFIMYIDRICIAEIAKLDDTESASI